MSDNKEENIALTSFDIADLDLYKKKIENICFIKSLDIEKAGGKIKIPTFALDKLININDYESKRFLEASDDRWSDWHYDGSRNNVCHTAKACP